MSVSIITFSNLGNKADVSAADILPVINEFNLKGELHQVIGKTNKNFYLSDAVSAIPLWLHYLIRFLQKFFKISMTRRNLEDLFDHLAQYRLKSSDVTIFHGGLISPKTLNRVKHLGSISVDIPRLAHLIYNAKLEEDEFNLLDLKSAPKNYGSLVEKWIHMNDFDYIIAFSDFIKDSYIKSGYPEERIFIAQQDIDLNKFPINTVRPTTFKVLYVAYSTPLKGLGYLLEAWNDLRLTEIELVLVGGYGGIPDKLKARYQHIIENNSNIKNIGHIKNEELKNYYHDASVLVFPSLTEGFGRVTLEAMACGLPVITTENARGIVEDSKTGFVVPIRDAKAIKDKIEFLYHNPEVRERMGKDARKAVENKKPFGEAVYEIYQEILKREGKK